VADNTIEILILAHDVASSAMKAINTEAQSLSGSLVDLGSKLTLATAGAGAVLAGATQKAVVFDETMTNIAATIGATAEQQKTLTADLIDFGKESRYGPQQAAEAYLDVASGVGNVNARMATMQAAVKLAEAGNAELAGTTKGMISIMNSYGFEAEQATYATDVMSKVVSVGVGSMDDFAAALPGVTGLAASLGIEFGELGAATALLTAKGATASVATTQLRAVMTSLLNPNEKLKVVLAEMGYETGQAAIAELGLHGAMMAVSEVAGDDLMGALGSAEAMMGVVSLQGEEAGQAMVSFQKGIDGATDAARKIQLTSTAAQMDLFNSSIEAIQLNIGGVFLPIINDMLGAITPILDGIFAWTQANPELTSTIVGVVSAIVAAGPIMVALGGAIGLIFSPISLVIGGIAALALAFKSNFGGIRDFVQPIVDTLSRTFTRIVENVGYFINDISTFGLYDAVMNFFGLGSEESLLEGIFSALFGADGQTTGAAREMAETMTGIFGSIVSFVVDVFVPALQAGIGFITGVILPGIATVITTVVMPIVNDFFTFLGNIWALVGPALEKLGAWFTTEVMPAVAEVIGKVILAAQAFGETLGAIWDVVSPALLALAEWFTVTALPAIMSFISDFVIPGIGTLIDTITRVWTDVSPFLVSLFDWFVNSALPVVVSFIRDVAVPVVEYLIDTIAGIWNIVSPILGKLYEWFVTIGLPIIRQELEKASTFVQGFIDILAGVWNAVSPRLEELKTSLKSIFDWVNTNVIQPAVTAVDHLIGIFSAIWDRIRPGVELFRDMTMGILNEIRTVIEEVMIALGLAQREAAAVPIPSVTMQMIGVNDQGQYLGNYPMVGNGTVLPASKFAGPQDMNDYIARGGTVDQSRDSGGPGKAGTPYLIGRGAQPEVFIPSTDGTFIPNFDKVLAQGGGGGDTYQVSVSVTEREIMTAGDAEANGSILGKKIAEELGRRG
jgi:TP901 family phage tail tape measure protein